MQKYTCYAVSNVRWNLTLDKRVGLKNIQVRYS